MSLVGILEVSEINGIELRPNRYKQDQYTAHCPVCGDRGTRRNLEVNASRDVFHCWACDAKGGTIQFHAWLRGISFEAAKAELYPSKSLRSTRRQHPAEYLTREQLAKIGWKGNVMTNLFKLPYSTRKEVFDVIWEEWQVYEEMQRERDEFYRRLAMEQPVAVM